MKRLRIAAFAIGLATLIVSLPSPTVSASRQARDSRRARLRRWRPRLRVPPRRPHASSNVNDAIKTYCLDLS